ncbi:C6 transcription factor protein [Rutstroemia sp. NJR-2017a BBW]|nr:C6 transcription factor protein [Rutstroemia sp. NJR-2017a BBW]
MLADREMRGDAAIASCSYAEKVEGRLSTVPNLRSNPDDMKARISRLENSILSMISSSKSESSENTPDTPGSVGSVTNLEENDIDQAGGQRISVDTRSTHWDAILNEIQRSINRRCAFLTSASKLGAMKEAWSDESEQLDSALPSATPSHRPSMLAGLTPPPDRAIILASLPSKAAADKLTQRFFDSYNPSIPATCE